MLERALGKGNVDDKKGRKIREEKEKVVERGEGLD